MSQENIYPSLDMGNYLLKVIGNVPIVIQPVGVSMCLSKLAGISDHWIAGGEPEGKIWQYYQNGKLLKSTWISENGKKYYIDKYGYMVTEWKIIEGKQYCW